MEAEPSQPVPAGRWASLVLQLSRRAHNRRLTAVRAWIGVIIQRRLLRALMIQQALYIQVLTRALSVEAPETGANQSPMEVPIHMDEENLARTASAEDQGSSPGAKDL